MGDIGQPNKEIEFEPLPASEPIPEQVPVTAPAEPVPAGA